MKAVRLPSGNYRCQVFPSKADRERGEKPRSFTASTPEEAEYMALSFKLERQKEQETRKNPTVKDVVQMYIDARTNSASPTTITGYRSLLKNAYEDINGNRVQDLNALDLQAWINSYSEDHSPKRVANAYNLLISAIRSVREWRPRVKMPQKVKPKYHVVTDEEYGKLLSAVKGTPMEAVIALAAFIPARLGEIAALEETDIDRKKNTVSINKNMVKDGTVWILKPPKTDGGYRTVLIPEEIIKIIPEAEGRIFEYNPNTMEKAFIKAMDAAGMKNLFRFHDLRHYGASWLHNHGVPTKVIQQRGGWTSAAVLEGIYEHSMSDQEIAAAQLLSAHFSDVLHETHTEAE